VLLVVALDAGESFDKVGGDAVGVVFTDGGDGLGDFGGSARAGLMESFRGLLQAEFREIPEILPFDCVG